MTRAGQQVSLSRRQSMKRRIKQWLAPAALALTAQSPRILMYHRFAPGPSDRRIDAARFTEHLEYLGRRFTVRPLREVVEAVRQHRATPSNTVVLTIDDGYRDFLEVAYPLLMKYGMPATLYVVSDFIDGGRWLWFDALEFLLREAPAGDYRVRSDAVEHRLALGDPSSRRAAWHQLGDHALSLTPEERRQLLAALEHALDTSLPPAPVAEYGAMSWSDLQALDAGLVEIGAHTRTHPILARCTREEVRVEVAGCRNVLEEQLGRRVAAFCYPNGRPVDVDDRSVDEVERAGYTSAVLAFGGPVSRKANPFLLPRIGAPLDVVDFRLALSGVSWLRGLKARA